MKRFAIVALLVLVGCTHTVRPTLPPPVPVPATYDQTVCGASNVTPVANGRFRINNNEWGSSAQPYCLGVDATGRFGIVASAIDQHGAPAPAAFASITHGCDWNGVCDQLTALPAQVGGLSVKTSWQTKQATTGFFDAGYDIWFVSSADHRGHPDVLELGVTLAHSPGWTPAGQIIGRALIGGIAYTVWGQMKIDGTCNYLVYAMDTQQQSVVGLDLGAIFADAVARGYMGNDSWLLSVQTGFEVWSGGVGLSSESFDVVTSVSSTRMPGSVIYGANGVVPWNK